MPRQETCTNAEDFFTVNTLTLTRRVEVLWQFQEESGNMHSQDGHKFEFGQMTDLAPRLKELTQGTDCEEVTSAIKSLTLCEILPSKNSHRDPQLHDRFAVLMTTADGKKAMISIAHYGKAPGVKPNDGAPAHPIKDGPAWFGGCGVYDVKIGSTSA